MDNFILCDPELSKEITKQAKETIELFHLLTKIELLGLDYAETENERNHKTY
jgi:hypothetical protein